MEQRERIATVRSWARQILARFIQCMPEIAHGFFDNRRDRLGLGRRRSSAPSHSLMSFVGSFPLSDIERSDASNASINSSRLS